ncbi:hypothetical protein IJZ97_00430 [bacterium]|nr:hypothetical protein [bacterium]
MNVEKIKTNQPSFQGIYNSRMLKKGLLLAADKGTLFSAGVSLGLSTFARPLTILATPKTDRENKEYACAKSISSSLINFGVMLVASTPVANAMKKIDTDPQKYLKNTTIKALKGTEESLTHSKKYSFASQLFKLGLGFVIAAPKSILSSNLIPPIMSKVFPKKENNSQKTKDVSFTGGSGVEKMAKGFGKIMDTQAVQKLSDKFYNSKFALHIMNLTDALATTTFIATTSRNKNIKEDRKRPLIYNATISTGLSIAGGYTLDKLLEKPTEKFIKKFVQANKDSKNLHKYIEGIHIAKAALLLGGIYYIIIPVISTFVADKIDKKQPKQV